MANRVINKGIEQVAIDLLKHHPRNANHGDVEAIKKSLAVNGWYGSVVVNTATKHILAGNHRVMAAKALGWETVPVQWVDVTPEEELRILVVDNRTTRIGQDDTTKITDILAELSNTPIGLDGTGYSADDLDALIDSLTGTGEPEELLTDPDEVPEEVETRCKPGDLWILGNHRLLCGDSTKAEDVERLMAGAKAKTVMTDPPYGMSYKGKVFGKDGLANDGEGEFEQVLTDAVLNLPVADAAIAVCFSPSRLDGYFRATAPLNFHRLLTIYKPNRMGYPWRGWILTSEVVGIFSIGSPSWGDGKACHDVYVFKYEDRPDRSIDHPTVKPLKIIADILEKLGSGSVYDPFLGSGTTLIAAEQLGRKCYGMEISPKYCDVIIQRWENATGKKAVLHEG